MSKGSLLLNNQDISKSEVRETDCSDAKINMVSGYKDLGLGKMDALKEKSTEPFGTDYKHGVFAPSLEDGEKPGGQNDEIREMKELLLIHLDFIQQQSEQLTTKDRQINELKNENEMLKMRIDRMERRVALQKSRAAVENGDGSRGESSGLKRRRRQSEDSSSSRIKHRLYQDLKNNHAANKKSKTDLEAEASANQQTMTEDSYWTLVGERDQKLSADPPPAPNTKTSALEVPKWRTKVYTSSYTMEGTENLSDDVFNRRHYRLEYDERRRKKWDVQRMREQRQVEKLAGRSRGQEEEGPVVEDTLQVTPDMNLLTLSVQPLVPVSAFSCPIPNVPQNIDFSLPWLTGKELQRRSRSVTRKGKR